jgi:hypothetical protein
MLSFLKIKNIPADSEEAVELEAQIGRRKRTMLSLKILRRHFEMSSFLIR